MLIGLVCGVRLVTLNRNVPQPIPSEVANKNNPVQQGKMQATVVKPVTPITEQGTVLKKQDAIADNNNDMMPPIEKNTISYKQTCRPTAAEKKDMDIAQQPKTNDLPQPVLQNINQPAGNNNDITVSQQYNE